MTERRGRPLSTMMVVQIRRLYREGNSIRQIERIMGVAKATVEKYLRGMTRRPPRPPKPQIPAPCRLDYNGQIEDLDGLEDDGPSVDDDLAINRYLPASDRDSEA